MEERVILVDENDLEIGTQEKLSAHREGALHRAFSLFVFNSRGKLLLHKRAAGKYHSGSLWANTCCSHPRPQETVEEAAHRKLRSEMGFDCDVRKVFHFIYKVQFENRLFEHELDHVFIGTFEADPVPNPEEVDDWKWVDPEELRRDLKAHPESYVYWLHECLDRVLVERRHLSRPEKL